MRIRCGCNQTCTRVNEELEQKPGRMVAGQAQEHRKPHKIVKNNVNPRHVLIVARAARSPKAANYKRDDKVIRLKRRDAPRHPRWARQAGSFVRTYFATPLLCRCKFAPEQIFRRRCLGIRPSTVVRRFLRERRGLEYISLL